MTPNSYYKQRNYFNIKLAQHELTLLSCEPITATEVTSHYSRFRNKANIVYGSIKAHASNRKWIKKINSLLFNNSAEFQHTPINAYYIVVSPLNSYLTRLNNGKSVFRTVSGLNPVKANKQAYDYIKKSITKNNRRKGTTKYFIVEQHQENNKSKGKLLSNYHDNYLLLTSRKLTSATLHELVTHMIKIYAYYNQISSEYISNSVNYLNDSKGYLHESNIDSVTAYVDENSSDLPYCKHINKGQSQLDDLKNTPDPVMQSYLIGLINTSKGIHEIHRGRASSLKKFINKSAQQAKDDKAHQSHQTTKIHTTHISSSEVKLIHNMSQSELLANLNMVRTVLKTQLSQGLKNKSVSHNKAIIKLIQSKLNNTKLTKPTQTKKTSESKYEQSEIKSLQPNTKYGKYVEYDKSTIIQYLELKCCANYGGYYSASYTRMPVYEMYINNYPIKDYGIYYFLSAVKQLDLFRHKPT